MSKSYYFMGWDYGSKPSQTVIYKLEPFEPIRFTEESLRWTEQARRDLRYLFGIGALIIPPEPPTDLTANNYRPRCNHDLKPRKPWKYSGKHPLDAWEPHE